MNSGRNSATETAFPRVSATSSKAAASEAENPAVIGIVAGRWRRLNWLLI